MNEGTAGSRSAFHAGHGAQRAEPRGASRPYQNTLAGPARFVGVGIHTGQEGRIHLSPAPADHGVVFYVGDRAVPARVERVLSTRRCTILGDGEVSISTVEHLLAALHGLRIDNVAITVEGPEIPILDGSAAPFVEGLLEAGVKPLDVPARSMRLSRPVWLEEPGREGVLPSVIALPAEGLALTVAVDFQRPLAGPQWVHFRHTSADRFAHDLAPARTFCFEDEVTALLASGLGGGGSVENTLVLSGTSASSPLRYADELARHKALDLMGDLALVGGRLHAHVIALCAGHALHVALAAAIRKAALG